MVPTWIVWSTITLDVEDWTELLHLCDEVAAVVRPRFGVVHRFLSTPTPWTSERDRRLRLVDFVAQPVPVTYAKAGPLGLAMRTYVGPQVADLFGRDRLLATPGVVEVLDDGVIRIDLARDLWNVSEDSLLERWTTATDHLAPSEALAEAIPLRSRRGFDFAPSPAWRRMMSP